jgi:hypothetical protein
MSRELLGSTSPSKKMIFLRNAKSNESERERKIGLSLQRNDDDDVKDSRRD